MVRKLILLFLCLWQIYLNSSESDLRKTNRIVGGYRCLIEDHPYMVAIRSASSGHLFCAGTLLNPTWVLTARHCVNGCFKTHSCFVSAGTSTRYLDKAKEKVQKSYVKKVYRHETDDIALMNLETPINESKTVRFVNLASRLNLLNKNLTNVCSNSTVMGWGRQNPIKLNYETIPTGKPFDPHLQCVQIPVIPRKTCKDKLKKITNRNLLASKFCAFKKNADTCLGDSGGPLMCKGLQYGITSGGYGCALEYPGLYMKVYYFEEFIKSIIIEPSLLEETEDRIISNNHTCAIFKYSFLVAIIHRENSKKFRFICTGSMLTKEWVLTAGYCTTHCETPKYYTVAAAVENPWSFDESYEHKLVSEVEGCFQSPDHKGVHDIAIMKLKKKLKPSKNLSFISFATSSDLTRNKIFESVCTNGIITGYTKQEMARLNQQLQCAKTTVSSKDFCKKTWNSIKVGNQHGCVFAEDFQTCHAEVLGAPLICQGILYGVLVSNTCNESIFPSPILIAKIYTYNSFLEKMVDTSENDNMEKSESDLSQTVNSYSIFISSVVCLIFNLM